jgi:chemotaxis protein methyltransferase CheR/type IV pilus assembly protein PilK
MAWSLRRLPALSDPQFLQWSKLLEERTGIQLAKSQKALIETQLSIRMRELGYDDYDRYFEQVIDGVSGMLEWSILVDRIAVKETSFFRHRPSLETVRHYLQNKINNQQLHSSFDVWSVGCATGEEAYSLAMVINDCFELASLDPYYGITALDISSSALNKARAGRYTTRKLDEVKPEEIKRYMHQCADGSYEVLSKLRDRVCFTHGNIIRANLMPTVRVDVIYCQNLLVYFRRWLRRDILNALVERLKPGGLLVIGLGEAVDWEHPRMQRTALDEVQAYLRDERE